MLPGNLVSHRFSLIYLFVYLFYGAGGGGGGRKKNVSVLFVCIVFFTASVAVRRSVVMWWSTRTPGVVPVVSLRASRDAEQKQNQVIQSHAPRDDMLLGLDDPST